MAPASGGRRFLALAVGATVCVVAVLAVVGSGLLDARIVALVYGWAAALAAGTAAVACWLTARRRRGVARRWRVFLGIGLAGWSVGFTAWGWQHGLAGGSHQGPSLADAGALTFRVFAVLALLSLASGATPYSGERGGPFRTAVRAHAVLLLDGLVVAVSLFLLGWSTSLAAVVAAGAAAARSEFAIVAAVVYPIADLALVTIVLLIASHRRVQQPRQLLLLGLGLVAVAVSDSAYAYAIGSGADVPPAATTAGFVVGPMLIALAALATDHGRVREQAADRPGADGWGHLMLPYLPLLVAGVVIAAQAASGTRVDSVELLGGFVVVLLVVVRQFLTLVDNTALLAGVRQVQERLAYQASHDSLTGLANQQLFIEQLTDVVQRFRAGGRPFGLFYIDLDDFKAINDDLGHFAGDALLQAVAGRLRGCVSSVDLVARLGGDEFAVLIDGDSEVAHRVVDRVTATMRRPFAVAGRLRVVHASLGLVTATDTAETSPEPLSPELLLRRADAAMYAQKRGRKREPARPLPGDADGVDLTGELAAALRPGAGWPGLDVCYQPIVRIANRKLVAVEALARWTSPSAGVIAPDIFVALAEQGGFVTELDNFVLDRACRELVATTSWGWLPLSLHVNVSASRLGDTHLVDCVRDALGRCGVPGEGLVLEITETREVPDFDVAADVMHRLHRLGVRLALDDLGTGYNTLAHLHRFPIDVVKVDRTFAVTRDSPDPNHTRALRRSIVSIARGLNVVIVIEGVETAAQAEELAHQGYELAQGHFYGRPAPLAQLRTSYPAPARQARTTS